MKLSIKSAIAVCAISVTVIITIAGFFTMGSPGDERARRQDAQRVNDLTQIAYAVDQYAYVYKTLPQKLEDLTTKRDIYITSITDPVTHAPYEYTVTASNTYELCATFETDSAQSPDAVTKPPLSELSFWKHGIGRVCYPLTPQQRI
jgi:hypothetical protein